MNRRGSIPPLRPLGVWAVLLFALHFACGSDNDVDTSPANPTAQATPIEGRWRSPCLGPGLVGGSTLITVEFNGTTFRRAITDYVDTTCQNPSVIIEEAGRFSIGTETQTGVVPLDLALDRVQVRPVNSIGELALESIRFCGVIDWPLGLPLDITTATGTPGCWVRTPRTEFDIYSLANDSLFFGRRTAIDDATSPSRRPRDLANDNPYVRL